MGEPVTVDSDDLQTILAMAESEVCGPSGGQACVRIRAILEQSPVVDATVLEHYERWLKRNYHERAAAEINGVEYAVGVLTELFMAGLEVQLIEDNNKRGTDFQGEQC